MHALPKLSQQFRNKDTVQVLHHLNDEANHLLYSNMIHVT